MRIVPKNTHKTIKILSASCNIVETALKLQASGSSIGLFPQNLLQQVHHWNLQSRVKRLLR